MSNSKQIDKLAKRAQTDEELLPLLMPEESPEAQSLHNSRNHSQEEEDDDEILDDKSARKRLFDSLTDDEGEKSSISLSYVLRGDILTGHWFRRQVWWIAMVIVMAFLYVSNRYYAQKQQILNEQLRSELKETHYDAMARSSQLMKNCRRSNIMERLSATGSTLTSPDSRPAVVPLN